MATLLQPLPAPTGDGIPSLLPGDHLDRETFHARYEAMPEGTRAELVGGVVYMPPLYVPHADVHLKAGLWLGLYEAATPGVQALDSPSVLLADDGEPQPDVCLVVRPECGGQTRIEGDLLTGPPELVLEVAYSSVSYDLHAKKRDYERAGVLEYVVATLKQAVVHWFTLRGDRFEELQAGDDGLFRSERFPGLWLDPSALLRRDVNALRAALERGCATPEHAEFAAALATRRR